MQINKTKQIKVNSIDHPVKMQSPAKKTPHSDQEHLWMAPQKLPLAQKLPEEGDKELKYPWQPPDSPHPDLNRASVESP